MGVINILPLISGSLVMVADITAFVLIMRIYLKHKRRSALFFSLAWLADLLVVTLSTSTNRILLTISELSLTVFAMLVFIGSVRFLEEESIPLSYSTLKKISLVAPIFYGFIIAVYKLTGDADWALTAGVPLEISGAFVFASGLFLKPLEAIYKRPAKILYISIILFGLHLIPAALFGLYKWYLPIGFTLSTILTVMMAYSMYRLTSTRRFIEGSVNIKAPKIHSGTIIVQPKEFEAMLPELENVPVLAFLRNLNYSRKGWKTYFITTIPIGRKDIAGMLTPTELAKMTEITFQYLEETSKMGIRGVVVIDCFEYLSIYNSWESLMKFLSKLRDLVLVNNGTLILVVEKDSLSENRYAQLRKLLE